MKFLDLDKQQQTIKKSLDQRIKNVLKESRYIMGPEVSELEKSLKDFSEVKYALTCASGTDALILALLALNIGSGDVVFCPSFTFPATAEAIVITGAKPVFIDVGIDTCNICYDHLVESIKKFNHKGLIPKAIIAVDLYGLPANYEKLSRISSKYNLKVISDAAQSYGGSYNNKRVGSLADITCTSFFPAKPLGCYGDGGAIFTDDKAIKEKIESLRSHGKGKTKYEIVDVGLNSRLDTIQAAILLSKLEIFEWENKEKDRLAKIYDNQINDFYKKPFIPKNSCSAWAQFTLQTSKRDKVISFLKGANIPTMIYYPVPMHRQPAYIKYISDKAQLPNSEKLAAQVFSIPIHPYLSEIEQEYIIDNLNKASKLL
ncbi:DegT/DnrJ/EryC1/StrS aminotransferase family protein [Alphaproteobacteria bacterium]|nr:DegT/DnrJ/EryC1/StrS aminotransferase family protein [Alphaproteobacteria bacterium]